MQCFGRTATAKRCKNETSTFLCQHHRWQPWLLFVATLSFLAVIAGLYQDVWKSFFDKEQPIPSIHGEQYAIARALLIREGWTPQANHWAHGDTIDIKSGNGPDLWSKGYHELDYCSGTGYALCRFEFNDANSNLLVVITSGESFEGDISQVKVFRVYHNPENKEGAYGDTLGASKIDPNQLRDVLIKMRADYQSKNKREGE